MLVSAVQFSVKRGEARVNTANVCAELRNAAERGVALVVFPECCLTGYVFDNRAELEASAIALDGGEIRALAEECKRLGLYAIVGFFERLNEGIHNSAVLLGPDGIVGVHRKNHLPYLGGDRFVDLPAASSTSVFATGIGTIGIAICYEIRFPEVMRTLMLEGAEIIVLPTNWPMASTILADHFTVVRAAENMVFFIAANRHDDEQGTRFLGCSQIVDPHGKVLVNAEQQPGIIVADIDLERARNKRIVIEEGKFELNPIRDRAPVAYRLA